LSKILECGPGFAVAEHDEATSPMTARKGTTGCHQHMRDSRDVGRVGEEHQRQQRLNEESNDSDRRNPAAGSDESETGVSAQNILSEIETSLPAEWLQQTFAPITAGPVVVPPLSDATLRRWAATTSRPTPYLPVHHCRYG
jgi:hypothetical protein